MTIAVFSRISSLHRIADVKMKLTKMHSPHLRYVILALFIFIHGAFSRTCGSDFEDVPSRTVRAGVVFEGSVRARHETFSQDGFYNATMKVRRVLKGDLPLEPLTDKYKIILVGLFGPQNREQCVYDIGIGTYIIFLDGRNSSSLDPKVPYYKISSFPEPTSKGTKKLVRKYRCETCARAPQARVRPREIEVQEKRKFELKCTFSGRPKPVAQWLKDNKPVEADGRIKITQSKRSTKLTIRGAKMTDEGIYTCEVKNVNDSHYADVQVIVSEPYKEPPHSIPCPEGNGYCLNQGTCYQIKDLGDKLCQCNTLFQGERCMERVVGNIDSRRVRIRQEQTVDRVLTGVGLGLTFLVLGIIVLVGYLLAKKKREEYHRQRRQKQMLEISPKAGVYSPLPVETTVTMERKTQPKPVMRDQVSQTETKMNAAFLGETAMKTKSPSLSERRSSLPSKLNNNNNKFSNGHLPEPRGRLAAISATPDMDESRRQPNVALVNAVVESDPEMQSKRSSPSQSSKTESAHAHLDSAAPTKSLYTDDTDLGSKGDISLDLDQQSDYDNQPASDMEVNLESEADIHGLDASGDEVEVNALRLRNVSNNDHDSSDSDSDETGSSIGEEQALFQHLQTNPRVRSLQGSISENLSEGSLPLSWEDLHHQPSYNIDPPRYTFNNPYALDNDILSNRYFHNPGPRFSSSQHKSLDDYDQNLPYDPDPDATVV